MLQFMRNSVKIRLTIFFSLILISSFFAIIISDSVSAIGIGPGGYTITYAPGFSQTLDFVALNNGNRPIVYNIYIRPGPSDNETLKGVFKCNKESLSLGIGQSTHFLCNMTLPNYLSPGPHKIAIGIIESNTSGGGTITVLSAVESRITINVPYAGFYPALSLSVNNTKKGDSANFIVNFRNWGDLDGTTSANIDVYSSFEEKVASLRTNEVFIKSMGAETATAQWTANVEPGRYHAVARTIGDGREINSTANFIVGALMLNIINLSSDVTVNEIGKFDTNIESLWPEPVNFDLQIEVLNTKVTLGSRKDSFILNTWGSKNFTTIWDTKITEAGNYTARVTVFYDNGKTTQKTFPFVVKSKVSPILAAKPTAEIVVIWVLGLMIFILLAMFIALIFFRRRDRKEEFVKHHTAHRAVHKKHK